MVAMQYEICNNKSGFAMNLQYLRLYYLMPRWMLAWLVGVPASVLRQAEHWRKWPDIGIDVPHSVMKRLTQIFNVDINDLMTKQLWDIPDPNKT